jgi:hypothetical protein
MNGISNWHCRQCGKPNTSTTLICNFCGFDNDGLVHFPLTICCPICGEKDVIQRLSAIVLGGKYYSYLQDGPEPGVTELSRLLTPPPQPFLKSGLSPVGWVGLIAFFGFWPAAFLLANWYYFSGGGFTPATSIQILVYFETFLRLGFPASLIIFVLVIAAMTGYHFYTKKRSEARYALEKPIWDRLMQRWNVSYYCHRDGVVFAIGTDKVFPAQYFQQFLISE